MKKHKERTKYGSGVQFNLMVELVSKGGQSAGTFDFTMEVLLTVLSVAGMLFSFTTAFQIPTAQLSIIIFIILSSLLSVVVCRKAYKGIACLVLIVGLVYYFKPVTNGFFAIADIVSAQINNYYQVNILAFGVKDNAAGSFLTFTAVVLSFLTAYVISGKGNRIFYTILAAVFVILPFAVGNVPNGLALAVFSISSIAVYGNGFRSQPDIRMRVKLILMAGTAALFILITIIYPEEQYKEQIKVEKIKNDFQDGIQSLVEGDLLNELFNTNLFSLGKIAKGGLSNGKLGEVSEVSFTKREVMKVVVPESADSKFYLRGYIGSEYTKKGWKELKSSTNKQYEQMVQQYGVNSANMAPLIKSLWKKVLELGPDTTIAEDFKMIKRSLSETNHSDKDDFAPYTISVKNSNQRDKTVYAPYDALNLSSIKENGQLSADGIESGDNGYTYETMYSWNQLQMVLLENKKRSVNYNFADCLVAIIRFNDSRRTLYEEYVGKPLEVFLDDGDTRYQNIRSTVETIVEIDAYMKNEKYYNEFVKAAYTVMPDAGAEIAVQRFQEWCDSNYELYIRAVNQNKPYSNKNLKDIRIAVMQVNTFMHGNAEYSLSPGSLPKGKDFVDYFLFEGKKGYCSYFATAATILFRSLNIPARYVEGYVVTDGDCLNAKNDGVNRYISIRDTNAHAWVEVYVDGTGWVPVEVTPGYGQGYLPDSILLSKSQEDNEVVSETKQETVTASPSPAATPAADEGVTGNTVKREGGTDGTLPERVIAVLLAAFLMIITAAVILIRAGIIREKGKRILRGMDFNKRQIYQYKELEYILGQKNHFKDKFILTEQYKKITAERDYFMALKNYVTVSRKAAFGPGMISREEWEICEALYKQERDWLYQHSGFMRKLYYMYIKVLV